MKRRRRRWYCDDGKGIQMHELCDIGHCDSRRGDVGTVVTIFRGKCVKQGNDDFLSLFHSGYLYDGVLYRRSKSPWYCRYVFVCVNRYFTYICVCIDCLCSFSATF